MWRMYVEFAYYGLIKKLSWAHGRRPRFVCRGPPPVFGSDTLQQCWQIRLLTGLLIFRAVAEPWISSKSAKSREIYKNTRNPAKFTRNLTKYISARHIWMISWLLGLLTCCKLPNIPWNFVTATSKQHPKLPGVVTLMLRKTGKQRCKNPGVPLEAFLV